MGYITPADVGISDDYRAHKRRNSKEPGTDYKTAYGTPCRAAGAGVVSVVDHSNRGAEGRRLSIDLYDGRRVSYIHLSKIGVQLGDHVNAGQFVMESGASGFGQDWYYGPHIHVSLWERPGLAYADTIDFEKYLNSGNNNSNKFYNGEDEEMPISYINVPGEAGKRRGGCYAVMRDNNGKLFARFVEPKMMSGVPTIQAGRALSDWDKSFGNYLK